MAAAGGVMLYMSWADLLAEAMDVVGWVDASFAFFAGMAVFAVLTWLVPEPTLSPDPTTDGDSTERQTQQRLLRTALHTGIGVSLHNFPEGIAVYLSCVAATQADGGMTTKGMRMFLAIALHNAVEGACVAAPIMSATGSRTKAFAWSLVSGLCEPLGALTVAGLAAGSITEYQTQLSLAAVAGIMVMVTMRELYPAAVAELGVERAHGWLVAGMVAIATSITVLNEALDEEAGKSQVIQFILGGGAGPDL